MRLADMKDILFSRVEEARKFESDAVDPVDRAFVQWAINQAMLRPTIFGDAPEGPFDMLYFANLMLEISKKRNTVQVIFDGRSDELW